jgi:hypothetical protein
VKTEIFTFCWKTWKDHLVYRSLNWIIVLKYIIGKYIRAGVLKLFSWRITTFTFSVPPKIIVCIELKSVTKFVRNCIYLRIFYYFFHLFFLTMPVYHWAVAGVPQFEKPCIREEECELVLTSDSVEMHPLCKDCDQHFCFITTRYSTKGRDPVSEHLVSATTLMSLLLYKYIRLYSCTKACELPVDPGLYTAVSPLCAQVSFLILKL